MDKFKLSKWQLAIVIVTAAAVVFLLARIAMGADGDTVILDPVGGGFAFDFHAMVAAGLVAILGWGVKKLTDWSNANIKNSTVAGWAVRIPQGAYIIVRAVEQEYTAARRKAMDPNSPGGTTITEAEAENAKAMAMAKLKGWLGPQAIADALKFIFGGDEAALVSSLSAAIESQVLEMKQTSAIARASLVPLPPGTTVSIPPMPR